MYSHSIFNLKSTADVEKESEWFNKEKSKELLCHKDMFMITQMLYDSAQREDTSLKMNLS